MDSKIYEQIITDEYNKWNKAYNETVGGETIAENGVAAFMCNAIAAAVAKSNLKRLKDYFYANANYD